MPTPTDPRLHQAQCHNLLPVQTLHENPWFWVRQRHDFYTVEPREGVALILPIVEQTHVVLVQVKRPVLADPYSLEIPAGWLEEGEGPIAGALRELREETGIQAQPEQLQPLAPIAESPRNPQLAHVFAARLSLSDYEARLPHDQEINGVSVYSFSEVGQLLLKGEIYMGSVVGVLSRFLLGNSGWITEES